jgi:hypothetical protein
LYEDSVFDEKLNNLITELEDTCSYTKMQYNDSTEGILVDGTTGLVVTVMNLLGSIGKWFASLPGKLFSPKNVVALTNGLDTLGEHAGSLAKGLTVGINKKLVSDEFIEKRFELLKKYTTIDTNRTIKAAVEYDYQMKRFEGLKNICDRIWDMAEASNTTDFASDKVFDQMASISNNVVEATDPSRGGNVRQFKWIIPFVRSFQYSSSKWANASDLETMKKEILDLKKYTFTKLIEAAMHIKKLCENQPSDVEHINFDTFETMTREFKRSYVVTKFIQAFQAIVLKEINYFCTTGISKIGKGVKVKDNESVL